MSALKEMYKSAVLPKLKQQLGCDNVHACPKMDKVVVHVGFGKHSKDSQYIENVKKTLRNITGQNPVDAPAKKSISNFKLREGNIIGAKVTLRGRQMYDFVERLINVTLPRVPDFRGLKSSAVDANGNMNIGFKDQIAFPESEPGDIHNPHGVQVTITTTADNRDSGLVLLGLIGLPFSKTEKTDK